MAIAITGAASTAETISRCRNEAVSSAVWSSPPEPSPFEVELSAAGGTAAV